MTSTSETGHAKNVANFDELISFYSGYGNVYNPTKPSLKLPALQALSASTKSTINAVNAALAVYTNAVAAREVAFVPMSRLITRVINALIATDSSSQVDDSAKTFSRKIQGKRASAKKTEEEKKALAAEGKEVIEISTSQMSYDSRLDNFDKLIKLLASVPSYVPNEPELKVESLITVYNNLKTKNSAVIAAATQLSNARILRNDILYKENTGLVDIALDSKSYIKSLFGAKSPQYKQVGKLEFRTIKV
jgi:hypothetical protein